MAERARLESVCTAMYRGFESLSLRHFLCVRLSCYGLGATIPVVTWVGLRTDSFREPRQVRKEAAAAKYFRVANSSGSSGIFIFRW